MTIDNAYLVLSVKEINTLAKAARAQQKAFKNNTTHTVVLAGLTVLPMPHGDFQITSHSFHCAISNIILN
jgi:hypothetical protein